MSRKFLAIFIIAALFASSPIVAQPVSKTIFGSEYYKHEEPVAAVAITPDGNFITGAEKEIYLWDSKTGVRIKHIATVLHGVVAMETSLDGTRLIIEDSC